MAQNSFMDVPKNCIVFLGIDICRKEPVPEDDKGGRKEPVPEDDKDGRKEPVPKSDKIK